MADRPAPIWTVDDRRGVCVDSRIPALHLYMILDSWSPADPVDLQALIEELFAKAVHDEILNSSRREALDGVKVIHG